MIDKDTVTDLTWAVSALESALKYLWDAERVVHEKRVALANAIDKASQRLDADADTP